MVDIGDCFLIVSGRYHDSGGDKRHPFVVVTEFDRETGEAILVSFSSTQGKPHIDKTTIVPAGSHEFIPQESYAAYYLAGRMKRETLEGKIKNGEAIQGERIDEPILEKLRAGIIASPETPAGIKEFYEDCLFRRMRGD